MQKRVCLTLLMGNLVSLAVAEEALVPGARLRLTGATQVRVPGRIEPGAELVPGESPGDKILVYRTPSGDLLAVPLPGRRLVGTLVSLDDDAFLLRLRKGAKPVRVPRTAVGQVEISRCPSRRRRGALIGFAIGFVAGLIAFSPQEASPDPYAYPYPHPYYFDFTCYDTRCQLGWAGTLGASGALWGALISPGERWAKVTPPRSDWVRLSVRPLRGGGALTIALSF